ncbi:MAG: septal ring lytic transglycosylase RlpA family protein [Acidobacteria bacterium]|nr:septal ring lytic transglycosylase RlpA family protein [Acidobacteriota bacterium]
MVQKTLNPKTRNSALQKLGLLGLLLALAFSWTSCHHRRPRVPAPTGPPSARHRTHKIPSPSAPIVQGQEGIASWYGHPFDGRRTSDGEIYNMHAMTAAHRTLPFGTMVRVHDLENGQSVVVRINDRGPFVEGRIIDLSYAAAQAMHMTGTALVRLQILNLGAGATTGIYAVQVGAFADPRNAERLKEVIEKRFQPVTIKSLQRGSKVLSRVLVGSVDTEGKAERLEQQLFAAKLATRAFVVRLN